MHQIKGELGDEIAREISLFSVFDLQIIGGNINLEIRALPSPYREKVGRFLQEQIFGAYHQIMSQYRSGALNRLTGVITDPELLVSYWRMVPEGCFSWDASDVHLQKHWHPRLRFFYYLIAGYTMFVKDRPGHPVGMPFPGGLSVEERSGQVFCPIRDKEKEVFFSICNYCPAKQAPE